MNKPAPDTLTIHELHELADRLRGMTDDPRPLAMAMGKRWWDEDFMRMKRFCHLFQCDKCRIWKPTAELVPGTLDTCTAHGP